jgi:hypothetical protein
MMATLIRENNSFPFEFNILLYHNLEGLNDFSEAQGELSNEIDFTQEGLYHLFTAWLG